MTGQTSSAPPRLVLLTGATGYVGGRLLTRLESRDLRVRCLARRPEYVSRRRGDSPEVVAGDVLDPASLDRALAGVDTAYYLIHSLGSGSGFEQQEREGAMYFARAARACGVRRIVYLGGLGADDARLSAHLRSRHEVGRILRESGVPTLELRASIVIGSGSLSFEMIRALVERLPAMITPRWVHVMAQPIAIDDLLQYLVEALDVPLSDSRIVEIGGSDQVSYRELMREYGRQRGLARVMIPVPLLTPRLSSLWLGLVTPLYARVGRRLIESITNSSVVRDPDGMRAFRVRPMGVRDAIAAALRNEDREFAASHWFDARSSAGPSAPAPPRRIGNRLLDSRSLDVAAPPALAFAPIARIGGANGWYAYNPLWRLRGLADLLLGGVGMRRGRPSESAMRPGAAIDFWRIEAYEPDRVLRLAAEMKLPGRAWLEFVVVPHGDGSTIRQTASFDPVGLSGLLYWYLLLPFHGLIFAGMLEGIARAAGRAVPPAGRTAETRR
jgi:uncharacterized protein YbjT (DUF2867 family)